MLFDKGEPQPKVEIPFPEEFRIGNVCSMMVFDLDYENIEYGYRMDGPFDPKEGHRFDTSKILSDPYAKALGGRDVWGKQPDWNDIYQHRSRLVFDDFDWGGDRPLEIPAEDLVIYEMHVRGFTRHPSSGVKFPGTFAGMREKIPYLKELGVNCVELLPIYEFDEFENSQPNPDDRRDAAATTGATARSASLLPRPAMRPPASWACRWTSSRPWSRNCTATASR